METFIVCTIVIVLMIIFAVLVCKLSSKLELKSQYEKPVPNNLYPATEEEKDLLKNNYVLAGTITNGKYANNLIDKWCRSLYVAYETVIDARDSITIGEGIKYTIRYATIQINNIQFEVELDNAILNDEVIIFYSKDDKEQMVYRFTIRKEKQNNRQYRSSVCCQKFN